MEARFTVGEMARLVGISKQTLIYYDREGVFCPALVDQNNGYRYYTADQLEILDSVLLLREMGVPLKEIRAHMEAPTAEETIAPLQEQQRAAAEKLEHWGLIAQRLERKLESLKDLTARDSRWLTERPAEYLAVEPVRGDRGLLAVDVALKRLLRRATEEKLPHCYQVGDMVALEDLERGEFLRFAWAMLPLQEARPGPGILEKPAGFYARCRHRGPYETMGEDYAALLARIRQAGWRAAGPSYEYCVLDSLTAGSPAEYLTEIQIPVIRAR